MAAFRNFCLKSISVPFLFSFKDSSLTIKNVVSLSHHFGYGNESRVLWSNIEYGARWKLVFFQLSDNKAWAVSIVLQINLLNLLNCKFFRSIGAPAFQTFSQWKYTVQPGNAPLWLVESLESWWLSRNSTIFNIIYWLAGSMGQTTHRPSVWCSEHFFS